MKKELITHVIYPKKETLTITLFNMVYNYTWFIIVFDVRSLFGLNQYYITGKICNDLTYSL